MTMTMDDIDGDVDEWEGISVPDYDSFDGQSAATYDSFADDSDGVFNGELRQRLENAERAFKSDDFTQYLEIHYDIQFGEWGRPSNLHRYKILQRVSKSVLLPQPINGTMIWREFDLQQKLLFKEILNKFLSQSQGWELFSFFVHLDTKAQSLIHPMIVFNTFAYARQYSLQINPFANNFMEQGRFGRRARSALSHFIPIFFGIGLKKGSNALAASDHKMIMDIVEYLGSDREYRTLLNVLVTAYEARMNETILRPIGFLQHPQIQRMILSIIRNRKKTDKNNADKLIRRIFKIAREANVVIDK